VPPAPELPRSSQRVRDALHAAGVDADIRVVSEARTAVEAAEVVGCELGAIVKSLVFRDAASGSPVLVLVSGANRADEAALGVTRADAAVVREVTGFAIGGVAPVGHPAPLRTLIDRDLLAFAEVWCAGGTPSTLFPIAPDRLVVVTSGEVVAVA
jgi:prolyl-tRNA editing enzyme YbaK/EbsC (Cys-tRNA(Pro) deacylase)